MVASVEVPVIVFSPLTVKFCVVVLVAFRLLSVEVPVVVAMLFRLAIVVEDRV